jgi:quercetin dioxygenase-like cupin family protein
MAIQVYDFRSDICQMLVTPHIRCRFLTMAPGESAQLHSHDLGHEIFLILQGRVRFDIAGEQAVLEAGQMCIARADEPHKVEVLGEEQMVMYLSVTPHVVPTHTMLGEGGQRQPQFAPPESYEATARAQPVDELLDELLQASEKLAETTRRAAEQQRRCNESLKQALASGDTGTARDLREQLWQGVYETFKQVYEMADIWNDVAPRAPQQEAE